jgi:outer membrane receptor protein involved in Fe transport
MVKKCLASALSQSANRQHEVPLTIGSRRKLSSCVALAIAGASMVTALNVEAAAPKKKTKSKAVSTKPVSELELENQQLRQALAAAKQRELELIKKGVAAGPAGTATATAQTGETVAAAEATPLEELTKPDESQNKDLGEVVVRARPKLEKLHDVAQSASVVSGKELDRELAMDLGAITRRASNIQFNQNNTRGASLSIRGVGKRSFSETQDPSVGITVDGVSYGLSQLANFSFYDVESVEVTRGPRGTEGGLSASSGKVNVVSKAPTFTPTAELSATYGEREALILKGALGGGVIDDFLAWRGSFIVDKGRGFYTNKYDSNYSLYNKDRLSGRVQFLFTPTSNLTAKISADFEPNQPQLQNGLTFYHASPRYFDNGTLVDSKGSSAEAKLAGWTSAAGVFTSPRAYFQNRGFGWNDYIAGVTTGKVNFNENQGQTVSNKGALAQVDWEVGNHVLSSNTAVREYRFDAHNDEGTPFDINVDGGGGVNYDQYTQEFKIRSKPGGFVDYKAGAFGIWTKDNIDSKTGWGADAGAWLASDGQYKVLDTNAGLNRGSGLALLKDSLVDGRKLATTRVRTKSGSLFGEADLHFTDKFTLTSGLRVTREDRTTRDDSLLVANGAGGALNPVSVNGVKLGGFNSDTTTGALGANSAAQLALANQVANRYFGKALYSDLTAAQQKLVANAKAIRKTQIGTLYNQVSNHYDDILYTAQLTPSYKINEDLTAYAAWQYGEKSGSALNINGISSTVKPEETHAIELGLKSFWLNRDLVLNTDAFLMDIKNYQQSVQVVNQYQTALNLAAGQSPNTAVEFTSAQGNVDRVRVYGVELDSAYNGIQNLSIRFNGSYNIAQYVKYTNAARPEELGYLANNYIDLSGATLPGASKWNFTIGAEYAKPVFDKYLFHTSFNTTFQTGFNNADNLSRTGYINARQLTDASIGIGTRNSMFDVSLVAKNLFNNNTHEQGWLSYSPNPYPVWFGFQVSGKI